ncbi:uncharacterized protein LOC123551986 isoform X2 [Mercenaria mercenaria]|uniref:uncharacterized protein LOC123551986 isoform X2 n=1 Tax=Mercenaria mercenaria TaxID=6596 RepID=UPI00234FB458|nr:uncharacterized protein LOC123551986 isoform X2 [Mercenaria mercenaria]
MTLRRLTSCLQEMISCYLNKTSIEKWIIFNNMEKTSPCSHNHVPARIIQYGLGGTATTLQFQILCVLMAILHEAEINSVGCYYAKQPSHKYSVIKTHFLKDSLLRILPSDSWIFMTSSDSLSEEKERQLEEVKRKIKNIRIKIPYIADINMVSKRGHYIVYEYQPIFNVSDKQMQFAVEYLRYWDILRLCCGKQMSADWRNHLSPSESYIFHHDPHSLTYPACEMYNISEVEQLMMKTYVYKQFGNVPSLHDIIGKPSNVDGDIDGYYCDRCNRNISTKHLGFNEKCA